jgi:hypothetical protein
VPLTDVRKLLRIAEKDDAVRGASDGEMEDALRLTSGVQLVKRQLFLRGSMPARALRADYRDYGDGHDGEAGFRAEKRSSIEATSSSSRSAGDDRLPPGNTEG